MQFGLQDETFTVPELEFPTVVHKSIGSDGSVKYHPNSREDTQEFKPIVNGEIVDIHAFLEFLKFVYTSILANKSKYDPDAFDRQLANIPLLLISHYSWSQSQIERINQYVFEVLQLNNFVLLPTSLAATHAMISLQSSLIIDIGADHTDILTIIDYAQVDYLSSTLSIGGNDINKQLSKILIQLSPNQIEDLKKSAIFEILSADAKDSSSLDFQNSDDTYDNALDVAAIITSGRDTREILEERERNKNKESVSNSQLETNSFTDRDDNSITVGKQRFHGCDNLINKISERVGYALSRIDDINKQKVVWENIVIVGGTSFISGLSEALLARLINDHLITEPEEEKMRKEQEAMDALSSKKKNKYMGSSFVPTVEYFQIPTIIKLAKYPEYFPDWKKHGYADIPFLGGQIIAKQIFTHSKDTFSITREKYNETGPYSIWEQEF